jgi:hypothetical protein
MNPKENSGRAELRRLWKGSAHQYRMAADKLPDCLDEIERLLEELGGTILDRNAYKNQVAELEERLRRHIAAQTCVSCQGAICPPMQCGTCIEREKPAQGMPARPVTAALRAQLKAVLAAFTVYINIPSEESWEQVGEAIMEASIYLGECPVPHPKG